MNFNREYLPDVEKKEIRHVLNWKIDDLPKKKERKSLRNLEPQDAFFKAIKPLIVWYRIMGRFPFSYTPEGKYEISIWSKWGVYWSIVYAGQTWLTIVAILNYSEDFQNSPSFFYFIRFSLNISMLMIQIFSIIPVLFETKKTVAYFNEWCDFQIEYESVIGKSFAPRSGRAIRIAMTLAPFFVAGVVYFQRDILFKNHWLNLLPYFNIFLICHLHFFFWTFLLLELRWASRSLRKHAAMLLVKQCTPGEISSLRKLWLRLSNMVQNTGNAFALSMIILTVLNGFSFVTASFALLASKNDENANFEEFLLVIIITGSMMVPICESGHRTTEQVGSKMAETLLTYDAPGDSDKAREVDLFIQAIKSKYPVVSFAGFFVINRSTLTSSIATIITYLIVLVQFQIST